MESLFPTPCSPGSSSTEILALGRDCQYWLSCSRQGSESCPGGAEPLGAKERRNGPLYLMSSEGTKLRAKSLYYFLYKNVHQMHIKGDGADAYTGTTRGQPHQSFDLLSGRPCSESQAIHRSRVNSEKGQRWKAQRDSRGGSAEVTRRPESRVRLSGTGSKMAEMEGAPNMLPRQFLPPQSSQLFTDPITCAVYERIFSSKVPV